MAIMTNVAGATSPVFRSTSGSAGQLNNIDSVLKDVYTSDVIQNLAVSDHPLYGMIGRDTSFYGPTLQMPLMYGNSHNRSANVANVLNNGASTNDTFKAEVFQVTRVSKYASVTIDGETAIVAFRKGPESFFDIAAELIESELEGFGNDVAAQVYREGFNTLCEGHVTTSGTTAGDTITLTNAADIVHFELGMVLSFAVAASLPGDYSTTAATIVNPIAGYGVITGLNRTTGLITVSQSTDIDTTYTTTLLVGDNFAIGLLGDMAVDGSNDMIRKGLCGLEGWIPAGTPGDLFKVVRTGDRERLAGNIYDGTSDTVEEVFINAMTRSTRNGARITHYFCNYEFFGALAKALGAKKEYNDSVSTVSADIGFRGIKIYGPRGEATVYPDPMCQSGVAWGLTMQMRGQDIWKIRSAGAAPDFLDLDGNQSRALTTSDTYQYRLGAFYQMTCGAPGANVRVTLPSI